MSLADPKETLLDYLQNAREAMLWKLEGLDELDIRRPLTPTGTNLLGLVKHLASVELGYFGDAFGRPHGEHLPWRADGADPNDDLWVTPEETRQDVVELYRRAWAHAAGTFETLDLDAVGEVPWWPPGHRTVTLHQVLVHMVAETCRHAGHADILREGVDGSAGRFAWDADQGDGYDWAAYVTKIEAGAATFR